MNDWQTGDRFVDEDGNAGVIVNAYGTRAWARFDSGKEDIVYFDDLKREDTTSEQTDVSDDDALLDLVRRDRLRELYPETDADAVIDDDSLPVMEGKRYAIKARPRYVGAGAMPTMTDDDEEHRTPLAPTPGTDDAVDPAAGSK